MRVVGDTEAELHDLAFALSRDRAAIASGESLDDDGSELRDQIMALAPSLLSGSSPEEAFDDLAALVTAAAHSSQARIEHLEVLSDSSSAGWLRRSGVRVSLEGDIRGIVGSLEALTTGPALRVDDLRILAGGGNQLVEGVEVLRTEFTVRGWYLTREVRDSTERTPAGEP